MTRNTDIDATLLQIDMWPKPAQSSFKIGMPKGVHVTYGKIQIIVDSERSQHMNRDKALRGLRAILGLPFADELT